MAHSLKVLSIVIGQTWQECEEASKSHGSREVNAAAAALSAFSSSFSAELQLV